MPSLEELYGITSKPSANTSEKNINLNEKATNSLESLYGLNTTGVSDIDTNLADPDENDVGIIESVLSGIGSGLIKIPEGVVSLGASLYDLGADTNTAAKVEKFFDDINPFDEAAEATTAGKVTEILVNLGVPGAFAFTKAASLADKALKSKKLGTYFTVNNPALLKAGKEAAELNAKGKTAKFAAASLGSGVADGVFVADVEEVGTFGDLLGGPTSLSRNEEEGEDATRELLNRVKFGTEGAVFAGIIGGVGSTVKKLATRGKDLAKSNSKIDRTLDKFAALFRARGLTPQEFFDAKRGFIGKRSVDVNRASEIARETDKLIDAIFPNIKSVLNKSFGDEKKKILKQLNSVLMSGGATLDNSGRATFGKMSKAKIELMKRKLRKFGATEQQMDNIFKNFEAMRTTWGEMFTSVAGTVARGIKGKEKRIFKEFQDNFGTKFQEYLGGTYDIFVNKPLLPFMNYKPSAQAVEKTIKSLMDTAESKGKPITREEAEFAVSRMVETARQPKALTFTDSRNPDPLFELDTFFLKKTIADDMVTSDQYVSLKFLPTEFGLKKNVQELFGKVDSPVQSMLAGTERLSTITRKNELFRKLDKISNAAKPKGGGLFFENKRDAIRVLGPDVEKLQLDPAKYYEIGATNPLDGLYTSKGISEALKAGQKDLINNKALSFIYDNFILYPKATSQIAKTILSPVTHVRNFVSASAFGFANGIIPGVTISPTEFAKVMKESYQALQIPVKGARKTNELYRELLELGVVNSNVRLGDLQRLLRDIDFGGTFSSRKGLRMLMNPLSKIKKVSEDLYTAEDDFWKIMTFAVERNRLNKAYLNAGIKKTAQEIKEEAASIVRNNVPNYDYVGEFIKGLRKFPIGNFVSFPAEILRTGTNIVRRALYEINYVDPTTGTKPLRDIGLRRLFGMTTTTAVLPAGLVEAFKFVQDVSDEELAALKRYVPDWSKNSTILPMKNKKTGEFKYIDFSHGNAYDTLSRPIQTVLNAVAEGRTDNDGIMDDFLKGLVVATKELGEPFISESIWTEAASDIIFRGGRTRDGKVLYTDKTAPGDKIKTIIGHLVESQTPGSVNAFKRLDLAFKPIDIIQKGEIDKYGNTFEIPDEALGFLGFRAVKVDPLKSIDFKIAEFQSGVRNSRREFTVPLLRGGPVDPGDIVDRYIVANKALYKTKQKLLKDYYAALRLGADEDSLNKPFRDRGANKELNFIKQGVFRPLKISSGVKRTFREIAEKNGLPNPFDEVESYIDEIYDFYREMPLLLEVLPAFPNPYKDIKLSPTDTSYLPPSGTPVVGPSSNLATTQNIEQKGKQVFGSNDSIFGG